MGSTSRVDRVGSSTGRVSSRLRRSAGCSSHHYLNFFSPLSCPFHLFGMPLCPGMFSSFLLTQKGHAVSLPNTATAALLAHLGSLWGQDLTPRAMCIHLAVGSPSLVRSCGTFQHGHSRVRERETPQVPDRRNPITLTILCAFLSRIGCSSYEEVLFKAASMLPFF